MPGYCGPRDPARHCWRTSDAWTTGLADVALAGWLREGDDVLAAEELRAAVRAIGQITGRVDVEELLDVIFRDFCIGK